MNSISGDENIRISPEIKTSQEALRRAQALIRMHNESSENSQSEVMAAVQLKEDSHALNTITPSAEAIDEAVKIISERLKLHKISEDDNYVCAPHGESSEIVAHEMEDSGN